MSCTVTLTDFEAREICSLLEYEIDKSKSLLESVKGTDIAKAFQTDIERHTALLHIFEMEMEETE